MKWCERLLGQVESGAADVGVGRLEQRQVVGVATGDGLTQVRGEPDRPVLEGVGAPEQRDALRGQVAEVDGVAAAGAADGYRDMLGALRRGLGVPQAQNAEPPDEVASPVPSRGPVVGADGQVDPSSRLLQLFGDLHPRRPGPDDQDGAVRQPARVAEELEWSCSATTPSGTIGGMTGAWKGPVATTTKRASTVPSEVSTRKPAAPGLAAQGRHLHTTSHRCRDLLRVGAEVVRDLLLRGEVVRSQAGELQARETVVPDRPVRDQGVPPLRSPALGDPVPLQNQVRHPGGPQVLTHRQSGLPGTDDENLYFLA